MTPARYTNGPLKIVAIGLNILYSIALTKERKIVINKADFGY